MITDEKFSEFIGTLSDQYEELKDIVVKHVDSTNAMMDLLGKLAEFRDAACTALRESHTTKNFEDN